MTSLECYSFYYARAQLRNGSYANEAYIALIDIGLGVERKIVNTCIFTHQFSHMFWVLKRAPQHIFCLRNKNFVLLRTVRPEICLFNVFKPVALEAAHISPGAFCSLFPILLFK